MNTIQKIFPFIFQLDDEAKLPWISRYSAIILSKYRNDYKLDDISKFIITQIKPYIKKIDEQTNLDLMYLVYQYHSKDLYDYLFELRSISTSINGEKEMLENEALFLLDLFCKNIDKNYNQGSVDLFCSLGNVILKITEQDEKEGVTKLIKNQMLIVLLDRYLKGNN